MTTDDWPPPPGDAPPTPPSDEATPPSDEAIPPIQVVSSSSMVPAALAIAFVTALLGGAAFIVLRDSGPSYPSEWDARVLDMVRFVEERRDLDWKHPVEVRFLADDEFEAELAVDDGALTDEDREELEQADGFFRALGLLGADVSLLDAVEQAQQSATLGFYSPDDKTLTVRGAELDLYSQETLVHELVHALQDQYFDILGTSFDEGAADHLDFIVEGDASRIAELWVERYSEEELADYERIQADFVGDATDALDGVPTVVQEVLSLPYGIGPYYVALLAENGGNEAVDAALESPPVSEEQVLDIRAFLDAEEPEPVDGYELADGETEIERDEFGMIGLALVLSGRVDPGDAFEAIQGWSGDEYVSFERDGVVCVETVMVMDSEADARELTSALDVWERSLGATARVDRDGSRITFGSCDPGSDAVDPPDDHESPLGLFIARIAIAADLVENDLDVADGYCFFDELIERLGPEIMTVEEPTEDQNREIFGAVATCGLSG